ncbi:MAG TPA: chemotaxis protein CheB [Pyrinomonadaceae bacterium]|jgi:two-component system CheB/CheR fusion protein
MSEEVSAPPNFKDLVVVGSSAGGIGALSVLVKSLVEEFPAPVVIAQHLDPQRPSHLSSILERHSCLPIVTVSDLNPTSLEAGTIYVVPANRHVKIMDGHVQLEGDPTGRPRPSVDLLLKSAAEAYGEHLIAVILTGSGSDGAAGAVDVKEAGGVVIIQNPETAQYPSMPQSLPPTAVDHVAELEEIGQLLYNILRGVRVVVPEEKADGDPVRDLLAHISQQTNIDFRNYKPATIMRRIARRMAGTHNQTVSDYSAYLQTHPAEVKELVRAFLIKVTGFFRDLEAFDFLRDELLPKLIEHGRAYGRVLRFWSAGCATGEEPYSLAIMLSELLGPELPEWSIKIFATDLDEGAINFSRRGSYPTNVLKDLPEDYRVRYFEPFDQGFRVTKPLRQLVIFGVQDLSRGVPFPRIDLVVCRNLLIYLKPERQQMILDLFAYSLHQTKGHLFLGKAETARPTKATFVVVNKKWKIYRCTSGPLAPPADREMSPAGIGAGRPFHDRGARGLFTGAAETGAANNESASDLDYTQLRHFNETMLRYLPIGAVVLDRTYRIVTINGTARRLLGIRDLGYDQDFLHAVRGLPYARVRDAIDAVFREHTGLTLNELELDKAAGGTSRYFDITVAVIHTQSGAAELAMLSITDATEQVQTKRRLEAIQAEQAQLVEELSTSNRRLSDMNKELQDANEELQATNEELMLTQEELQATNEEFEATNEELQATNEELETNNEEMQATNEELQTTNDELMARTHELQEMERDMLREQARLRLVAEFAPFNVLVLGGPSLAVEFYSAGYARLFGGREVVGRALDEVLGGAEGADEFVAAVREAYGQNKSLTTRPMPMHFGEAGAREAAGHFVHTIVPIRDDYWADGIIIYSENQVGRGAREAASPVRGD